MGTRIEITKEKIESLIWKCFECKLTADDEFETYYPIPNKDIRMRFFNLEDYENYNGETDTFGWGILLQNYEIPRCLQEDGEPDETMFYIYEYFNGTPADLFKNYKDIVSGMAEDIAKEIKNTMTNRIKCIYTME